MQKKVFIIIILSFFLGSFLLFTNIVLAQEDFGLSDIAGSAQLDKGGDLPTLFGQILGAGLSFIGIIFFLLMIYGGVLWMTAHGNSQQTDKALSIIMAAVIGLIIVLGSYAFTNFIFTSVETSKTNIVNVGCVNIDPAPSTCLTIVDCKNDFKNLIDCDADTSTCCVWQ